MAFVDSWKAGGGGDEGADIGEAGNGDRDAGDGDSAEAGDGVSMEAGRGGGRRFRGGRRSRGPMFARS